MKSSRLIEWSMLCRTSFSCKYINFYTIILGWIISLLFLHLCPTPCSNHFGIRKQVCVFEGMLHADFPHWTLLAYLFAYCSREMRSIQIPYTTQGLRKKSIEGLNLIICYSDTDGTSLLSYTVKWNPSLAYQSLFWRWGQPRKRAFIEVSTSEV